MRERLGTKACVGNRTAAFEPQRSNVRAIEVLHLAILKEQAERCRRLAKQADPFTEQGCWISPRNTKRE
jgi:hypothetical protein